MEKMPHFVKLTLKETHTFFILNIVSQTPEYHEDEEAVVENEDTQKDDNKSSTFKNSESVVSSRKEEDEKDKIALKFSDQIVQTINPIIKSRKVQKSHANYKDKYVFAATWDMFDNYNGIFNDYLNKVVVNKGLSKRLQKKHYSCEPDEDDLREMRALIYNKHFLDAVQITERLLSNNNYKEQQKKFRGLLDQDPFRKDIEFNYNLRLLWTFTTEDINGKCVSCFNWNTKNKDILAVGYGKFYFNEKTDGAVLIWNVKNPIQPERAYYFEKPVSAISFSNKHPHLLAVGFDNGYIKIIDISKKYLNVITQTTRDSSPCYEAITQIVFLFTDSDLEDILSISKDGKICKTGPIGPFDLKTTQIMLVCKTEGTIKGVNNPKNYPDSSVKIQRTHTPVILTIHPKDDSIYYIGTAEGTIHKFSKYNYHKEINSFIAHDGCVNQLKFSPYCNKIILTCGDDWYIRLWIDGIFTPILEMKEELMSILGADWCPSISTVIASICGENIIIWDVQRKTFSYQSCIQIPRSSNANVIQFTSDGRCVIVGDIVGNVYVYAVENMPFAPFFQANALIQSLKRALATMPENIKKMLDVDLLQFKENDK